MHLYVRVKEGARGRLQAQRDKPVGAYPLLLERTQRYGDWVGTGVPGGTGETNAEGDGPGVDGGETH